MIYRLYTEDIHRDTIINLVSSHYNSFALFTGLGYWQGKPEQCLVIEIVADSSEMSTIEDMLNNLKVLCGQDCVLLVAIPCESKLV